MAINVVVKETISPPQRKIGGRVDDDPGPWFVGLCPRCSRNHHFDLVKGDLPAHCARCGCPMDVNEGRKFCNEEAARVAKSTALLQTLHFDDPPADTKD